MDDRVWPALFFLIPVVGASAQPVPEGTVARIATEPGELAFTGRIWTSLSPDGQTIAVTDEAGRLDLWDISAKRLKTLRATGPTGISPRTPRWSPDSQRLYSSHEDGVAVWDVTHADAPHVLAGGLRSSAGRQIAVSPDGKFVVASMPGPTVVCWDADTGRERWRSEYYGTIGVSADSRFVVRSYFGARFESLDAMTGRQVSAFGPPFIECKPTSHEDGDNFAVSPDGRYIAVCVFGSISLRDARTGQELWWKKRIGVHPVCPLAFSPDGHWLATVRGLSRVVIWDADTGEPLRELESHGPLVTSIDFTANSRRLLTASVDGTALVRDLASSGPKPEDAWLALASEDGKMIYAGIWSLARDSSGPTILRTKLPPVPGDGERDVVRLIADLDAPRHAVRERASRALSDRGRVALPALRSALARAKSAEAAARLEKLIQAVLPDLTAQEITHRRAVKAMSLAGTAEARELLAEWAAGAPGAVLTDEAKAALRRR